VTGSEPKERLLGDLAVINEALERHGAVPDITVREATSLTQSALRTVVEASSHRLAALIKMQM